MSVEVEPDWIEDIKKDLVPLRSIINQKIRKWALDHEVPIPFGYDRAYREFARITGVALPGTKKIDHIEKLGKLGTLLDIVAGLSKG
jgi:hypothetical protein